MPLRPFSRTQAWLLPPSLEEMIASDHPVRFVAAFVDSLRQTEWQAMGIDIGGEERGAPAYHPRALLGIWLYGFMSGVRSARKLERACGEQLPYLWLGGSEKPDHNTLWRFYQANREGMRELFRRTVRTAVKLGLTDLALQAVDGTKVGGNATGERTYSGSGLRKLLERTEAAIAELEDQNVSGEGGSARLPERLARAKDLGEQVRRALSVVEGEGGPKEVNLTDGDVRLMRSRGKIIAGYNAQAAVVRAGEGYLISGARVSNRADDHGELIPTLELAAEALGSSPEVNLADGGYYSGANLEAAAVKGYRLLVPEGASERQRESPYHRDKFSYDEARDSYICPKGEVLGFQYVKREKGRELRVYRGRTKICHSCPAFGECTKNGGHGRELLVSEHEERMREHRQVMASPEAKERYRKRKEMVEPVFGILKECLGARRFLLRGLRNVEAEWSLIATGFNLKTLWRWWRARAEGEREEFFGLAT